MEMGVASDLEVARGGNREAAARLLEPMLDPGYRLAFAILRRRDAAEDAVQDSCFSALRSLPRFRGDHGQLRPWFLTIVANQCRSQMRRPFFGWVPIKEYEARGDLASEVSTRHDLGRQLNRLRSDQRTVLALFYYMDLPLAEVAQILGISEGAARSRLYRAVGQLRKQFQEAEVDR